MNLTIDREKSVGFFQAAEVIPSTPKGWVSATLVAIGKLADSYLSLRSSTVEWTSTADVIKEESGDLSSTEIYVRVDAKNHKDSPFLGALIKTFKVVSYLLALPVVALAFVIKMVYKYGYIKPFVSALETVDESTSHFTPSEKRELIKSLPNWLATNLRSQDGLWKGFESNIATLKWLDPNMFIDNLDNLTDNELRVVFDKLLKTIIKDLSEPFTYSSMLITTLVTDPENEKTQLLLRWIISKAWEKFYDNVTKCMDDNPVETKSAISLGLFVARGNLFITNDSYNVLIDFLGQKAKSNRSQVEAFKGLMHCDQLELHDNVHLVFPAGNRPSYAIGE